MPLGEKFHETNDTQPNHPVHFGSVIKPKFEMKTFFFVAVVVVFFVFCCCFFQKIYHPRAPLRNFRMHMRLRDNYSVVIVF